MSRISSRVSIIAAVVAIVLLVVLVAVLWTGVRSNAARITLDKVEYNANTANPGRLVDKGLLRGVSSALDKVEFVTSDPKDNLTNEVLPEEAKSEEEHNDSTPDILPRGKTDLEYVKLLKISQNQYEDSLGESSEAKRQEHSGHFRHAEAEVWDPHPQYEFTAFGRRFRLRLAQDSSFVSPDVKITSMTKNSTMREHPGHQLGCFYSGYVDGDPSSTVTVSLCHGMTGHMRTSSGNYFIKPTEHWYYDKDSPGSTVKHAISRIISVSLDPRNDVTDRQEKTHCGVIDYSGDASSSPLTSGNSTRENVYVRERRRERRSLMEKTSFDRVSDENNKKYEQFVGNQRHRNSLRHDDRYDSKYYSVDRRHSFLTEENAYSEMESDSFATWRPRRALPREYFIEIMVVADSKMIEYHGNQLTRYILVLMSMVSKIYKDPSIGNPINIAVTKIQKTEELFGTKHRIGEGISASEMLKKFCLWQQYHNPNEPSAEHHDVALLLTRETLCYTPNEGLCDTLGLAEVGKICSPRDSCTIVQDNGLGAAFTIAHEIGHVLNMPHDDDTKCMKFRNRSRAYNIMSSWLNNESVPWEWSKCSRHHVTEFLDAGYGDCLLNEPGKMMQRDDDRLPGEDYSKNRQCELVFGPGSRICDSEVVCARLWCTDPRDRAAICHTQNMPWADGTPCDVGKWCHRGECVSKRNLQPINGQWSEWGQYYECSRTCGGGVQKKKRECNSPPPQHGGKYCVGEHVEYRSCNIEECPTGSPSDFRDQQCASYNNKINNIESVPRDARWHAKYSEYRTEREKCRLYCGFDGSKQSYLFAEKVIDGTPCGLDTFDICVNGRCEPAGCDHVLGSPAALDACGVCGGDNSTCQRIAGSYNTSAAGYNRVTKIPAGSSYIDIRQYSWLKTLKDDNYLALRLGEGGKYILNGNNKIMRKTVIAPTGIPIEYSGSELVVERLNSSRPLNFDLVVEVVSKSNAEPPQIVYEYTVPKRILKNHTWILNDWSGCSHMCQGMKYRRAECRSTESKELVPDDYCRSEEKPREETQLCNSHCALQWQAISKSECSNHCGAGIRSVTSRCIQSLLTSEGRMSRGIPAYHCHHLARPSEHEPCTGPCEDAHWNYSEWGPCTVTCGSGHQYRKATCVDSRNNPISNKTCADKEKTVRKTCTQKACPKWEYGEWSTCSVTCGKGKRYRLHWCHVENRVVPESFCSIFPINVMEVCDAGPCHRWQEGDWSSCSVTCGEGTRRRKVVCKNADGSSSDECSISEKPEDASVCALKPCPTIVNSPPISYSPQPPRDDLSQQDNEIDGNGIIFHPGYAWKTGIYGECSKSCNGGIMNRIVKCISIETGIVARRDYCDARQEPPWNVSCNNHPCPDNRIGSSVWKTGDWSQCNVECGDGFQHRQVRCQSFRREILPDEECSKLDKPRHTRECQKAPCTTEQDDSTRVLNTNIVRRWRVSNWTPCSKTCGSGTKTRRVECTSRRGLHGPEIPVKDELCSKWPKPKSQRPCQRIPCDYTWQETPWSECSTECDEGLQRRIVTCHRVNQFGWIDPAPTAGCPIHQKPTEDQVCKVRSCSDKHYWVPGPWRKCSHPCGRKGRQTRRLFCRDSIGKKVARFNCPAKFKPVRKRKCNLKRCGPLSCLEVQKRSKIFKDGEYALLIGGRNMSIYCHNMDSDEPREYLTLPIGDRENYAEIYDKRLINPKTCPYNGQRNDSCHCATDLGTVSGKTMFKRVRIDPAKLYIIADDYTFSWTKGSKRVEFGRTGDCYSLAECPQGRFSINLSGTALKLATDVTWVPEKTIKARTSLAINRINDQRVIGKCGGYCGFCSPKAGLKLDVLPP
ncbi:A disintegrin and metalloproteinase with thrombospondin motifs 9-like isoform X2 [Prorops nasuta]|uniref:A disintegrin and metalloproteinase with thrombospondin motifs 9-like isoform X2 n=1 Tax=Prorops nasuta TaxID=863751 RepID=UPI0034CD6344